MKKILIFILVSLYMVQVSAQFSLRRNTVSGMSVDVLYTPPASGVGTHSVQYIGFSVKIPYNASKPVTAAFTPAAPLASIASFVQYNGQDGTDWTYAWSSSGTPTYTSTFAFVASTEVTLGTIAFSPGSNAFSDIVTGIDMTNSGGGNTGGAYWTMQIDAGGTDVSNYASLFYQSAASGGTPGSDAPTTTSGNQTLFLTNTPLPVTLVSFTGAVANCASVLKWTTAAEYNSNYYAIEHSSDGIIYTEIARVNSNNSGTGASYTYTDKTAIAGINYYRLKPTDFDGHFKYSDIVTVTTNCSFVPIRVTPNPAVDIVTVTGLSGKNTLVVIDAAGKQVATIITATPNQKINMGRFSRGKYTITVTAADGTKTTLNLSRL